jgi:hypothetical protein
MSKKLSAKVSTRYRELEFRAIAEEVALATGVSLVFEEGSNPQFTIITSGGTMDQTDNSVNIGRDSFGQTGQTLMNCTNMIQQQPPGAQRDLLEKLQGMVKKLVAILPEEKREETAGNLELMIKAATSSTPNRRWYEVSAEGLLDAAKWVADFSENIAETIGNLGRLIWPNYLSP